MFTAIDESTDSLMFAYDFMPISDAYLGNPISVPIFIVLYFHRLNKKLDLRHNFLIAYGAPLHRFQPL